MLRADIAERLLAKEGIYQDMVPAKLARLLSLVFGKARPIRVDGKVGRGFYRDDITPIQSAMNGEEQGQ
jgi:hypothetical protein